MRDLADAMTWQRALTLTGALWIILVLVGNDILGTLPPGTGEPLTAYSTYYADVTTTDWVARLIELAGLGFGLVFVSVVAERISATGTWSRLALVGGAAHITVKLVSGIAPFAAMRRGSELSPELLRSLTDIGDMAFAVSFLPLALFALAASAGARQTGAAPAWATWFGFLTGVLLLVGAPFAVNGPGWIGAVVFLAWALTFSVTLFLRQAGAAPGAVTAR
jgi:hypothetical protein